MALHEIPFKGAGWNYWTDFCRLYVRNNRGEPPIVMAQYHRKSYPAGRLKTIFEDKLFAQGAVVIARDKMHYLRFFNKAQLTMFVLKWS